MWVEFRVNKGSKTKLPAHVIGHIQSSLLADVGPLQPASFRQALKLMCALQTDQSKRGLGFQAEELFVISSG